MYEQYWKLERSPFENDADSRFFFRGDSHQAGLLKLRFVVEQRRGAALLCGEFGYGKTYLTHMLESELPQQSTKVYHIVFPQMSADELLAYLAVELGADDNTVGSPDGGLDRTVRQIERLLTIHTKRGQHSIIVVDEAHLINDPRVLRTLQLLLNFRQPPAIDFSLILVGEPTLLSQVQRMTPLDERIAVKALLGPLSADETTRYVLHRLEVAGATQPIFDPQALRAVFELSGGVPRKINRLCDMALLVGYADELTEIAADEIEAVSQELTSVLPD